MNKLYDLYFLLRCCKYHILLLSETWMHSELPDSILTDSLPFTVFRGDRLAQRGGGVAILVDNAISSSLVVQYSKAQCEGLVIDIYPNTSFSFAFSAIRLINIYRSPSCGVENTKDLCSFITSHVTEVFPTILCGDMNLPKIDWANLTAPNTCSMSLAFLNMTCDNNLKQLVLSPTRLQNTLDCLLCNSNIIKDCIVRPPFSTSDHASIYFEIRDRAKRIITSTSSSLDWKKADWEIINSDLFSIDWTYMLSNLTIDESVDKLTNIIQFIMDNRIPKNKNVKTHLKYPPKMRRLYSFLQRSNKRNPLSITSLRTSKKLHKELVKFEVLREDKLKFPRNYKVFFRTISNRIKSNTSIPALIVNNKPTTIPFEQATHFAEYFDKLQPLPISGPLQISRPNFHLDHINDISPFEVNSILKRIAPKLNSSPDFIPSRLLKNCLDSLAIPLSIIFTNSLTLGHYPLAWKKGIIKPVHKKGPHSQIENYRPITMVCSMSKVFEKLIFNITYQYLETNGILHPKQHGFRRRRSTVTSLVEAHSIYLTLQNKKIDFDICLVDFSRAFDSVNIRFLVHKLEKVGITGNLLYLIRSFLTSRSSKVSIGDTLSGPKVYNSGVPQGSCLGPLLFSIFINDIMEHIEPDVHGFLYADDLKIFSKNRDSLQKSLDSISDYSLTWGLVISTQKCFIMHCGPRNPKVTYNLEDNIIPTTSLVKDLGITFQEDITFSKHIELTSLKSQKCINMIFRAFKTKSIEVLLRIYTTYIRPLIEYGSEVWSPVTIGLVNCIEKVQRSFTRRLLQRAGLPKMSYVARLNFLSISSLEYRRNVADLVFIHKCLHGNIQVDYSNMFKLCPSPYSLRESNNYRICLPCKYKSRTSTCASRMINVWNKLPCSLVSTSSSSIFRNELIKLDCETIVTNSRIHF